MTDHPNDVTAETRLQDLGLTLDPRIQWNTSAMFPKVKGLGAKSQIKQRHKLIKLVEAQLVETLLPGEEVQYVAKGVQMKFAEQFFMGALLSALINQTVFVLTNVRILMFNTNTRGKPRHQIWMVYYSEITKFKKRWSGSVTIKLKDKSSFVFTGFKGNDRKAMPGIFERAQQEFHELEFNPEVTQSRENLCFVCKQVVPKGQYQCNHCGQNYWRPDQLAFRSLLVPSWGDWLMGHRLIAFAEFIVPALTWLGLIGALADPKVGVESFAIIGIVLGGMHVLDSALTYAIAKKGLNIRKPLAQKPDPQSVAPESGATGD